MAACNIGGVTLHSFCGLGINDAQPAEEAVTNVRKNKKLMSRWLRTKVLVIDEGRYSPLSREVNRTDHPHRSLHD